MTNTFDRLEKNSSHGLKEKPSGNMEKSMRRHNVSFAEIVKGMGDPKEKNKENVQDKGIKKKTEEDNINKMVMEVDKDSLAFLESKWVGEIKIEVDNKLYTIRVKEVENKIVEEEDETEEHKDEDDGDQSEGDNSFNTTEDDSPEGFSDEENDESLEYSIIRESSPEMEYYNQACDTLCKEMKFNNQKRDDIIKEINESFGDSSGKLYEGEGHIINNILGDSGIQSFQMLLNQYTSPTQEDNITIQPNIVIQTQESQSPFEYGNKLNKTQEESYAKVSDKQQKKKGDCDVDYGDLEGISEKMQILLSRDTPLGKKLKFIEDDDYAIEEQEKKMAEERINRRKNILEKRITRSQSKQMISKEVDLMRQVPG
ncbi:hypothetical protein L2E82_50353 [Cichorium intybus]|nr:hypothetical protein L2E82_50353 [Cichorium intybus]